MNTRKHKEVLDNFIEIYERVMPDMLDRIEKHKTTINLNEEIYSCECAFNLDFLIYGVKDGAVRIDPSTISSDDADAIFRNQINIAASDIDIVSIMYHKAKIIRSKLELGFPVCRTDEESLSVLVFCLVDDLEKTILSYEDKLIDKINKQHENNLAVMGVVERYINRREENSVIPTVDQDGAPRIEDENSDSSFCIAATIAVAFIAIVGFVIALNK